MRPASTGRFAPQGRDRRNIQSPGTANSGASLTAKLTPVAAAETGTISCPVQETVNAHHAARAVTRSIRHPGCRPPGLAVQARLRHDRSVSEDLSATDYEQLRQLLQRFAERHLDQFENLRFETSYSPVFVHMTRELPSGWPPEAFKAMR